MAEAIDLTGDGGVMKTIVRRAKPDAVSPSETIPLVDGMLLIYLVKTTVMCLIILYVHMRTQDHEFDTLFKAFFVFL